MVFLGIGFALQALAAIVGLHFETTGVAPALATAPLNDPASAWGWIALRQLLGELSANHEFWNGFWAAVFGAAFGAFLAFTLERNRRNRERIRDELGQCHTLVYMLTHMLSMLEDFQEQLFTTKAKELGRPPKWSEIGGLEGAPERVPSFALGEYVFLLDKPGSEDKGPELLNDIYLTVSNMEMVLGHINLRTRLWHEYLVGRAACAFQRGEEAVVNAGQYGATAKRIEELTLWLAEDLPEAIVKFRSLFPRLYDVLKARYPKESFLYPASVH